MLVAETCLRQHARREIQCRQVLDARPVVERQVEASARAHLQHLPNRLAQQLLTQLRQAKQPGNGPIIELIIVPCSSEEEHSDMEGWEHAVQEWQVAMY